MVVRVTCPNPECGELFKVKEAQDSQRVKCPACDKKVLIPGRKSSAPAREKEDDRPEPTRSRRGGRRSAPPPAQSPWPWIALAGGALLAVAGGLTAVVLTTRSKPAGNKGPEVATSPAPIAPTPLPTLPLTPGPQPGALAKDTPREAKPQPENFQAKAAPSTPAPAKQEPPKPTFNFEPLKASIAVVRGKRGHGSGFVVLPNVIATNSHVIRNDIPKDVTVRFITATGSEQVLNTKLLYQDKARDLALLLVESVMKAAPLPINAGFIALPGKAVTVIGNPAQGVAGLSQVNAVGRGQVASIALMNGKPFVHIRVPQGTSGIRVGPGNSGGPVFDQAGQVIGVLSSGLTVKGRPLPDCFCIPAGEVKTAMDSLGAPGEWAKVVERATAQHVCDIALAQLSINYRFAKRVLDVREDVALGVVPANVEARLIEDYKKIDRVSYELSRPALAVALADNNLSPEVRKGLKAMGGHVDTLRKAMTKGRVQVAEYKRCLAAIQQFDKAFALLKDKSGLNDDEVFREMMRAQAYEVLNKLDD